MHLSCKFRDYTFSWLLRVYFVFIFERYFCCFSFSTLKLSLNCHLACMVSLLLTLTFVPLYIIFLFPWATFKIFSWSFAYITLNIVCLGVFWGLGRAGIYPALCSVSFLDLWFDINFGKFCYFLKYFNISSALFSSSEIPIMCILKCLIFSPSSYRVLF